MCRYIKMKTNSRLCSMFHAVWEISTCIKTSIDYTILTTSLDSAHISCKLSISCYLRKTKN